MQNQSHQHHTDDKFAMNFNAFDPELFSSAHMGQMAGMNIGMKRSAQDAGLDREPNLGLSSDDDQEFMKKEVDKQGPHSHGSTRQDLLTHHQTSLEQQQQAKTVLPNGKKTKGRVKIKMEFIDNKLRRYTTFSKRKTGIMKKAYELSTLTGTQVMLLVASETGHVYTFATRKLQPMITSEAGKALIQTCLNSPDPPQAMHHHHHDQRMSATGFEETELTYAVNEEEHKDGVPISVPDEYMCGGGSSSPSDSSSPPTPSDTPTPQQQLSSHHLSPMPIHLPAGLVLAPSVPGITPGTVFTTSTEAPSGSTPDTKTTTIIQGHKSAGGTCIVTSQPESSTTKVIPGGSMMMGGSGGSVMYAAGGGMVYAAPPKSLSEGAAPILFNLPQGLHMAHDQNGGSRLVPFPMALTSAALQQSAAFQQSAAAAIVSAANAVAASATAAAVCSNSNSSSASSSSDITPTDLSMHIKREKRT